jgi:hypothetical protein
VDALHGILQIDIVSKIMMYTEDLIILMKSMLASDCVNEDKALTFGDAVKLESLDQYEFSEVGMNSIKKV